MALVCVLQSSAHPDLKWEDGTAVMQTVIGYDDARPVTYSLFVSVSPMPGIHEITFCIIEVDGETGASYDLFSGLETKAFLPSGPDRQLVRQHVLGAVSAMVSLVSPQQAVMCTVDADKPPQALSKYQEIASTLGRSGYTVETPPGYAGQHIWIFKRVTP